MADRKRSGALLNYTTSVPVEKTLAEIQAALAAHRASRIVVDYEAGLPVSISFALATPAGVRSYALPARSGPVLKVLLADARAGRMPKSRAVPAQAARVAWRIIKDWLLAQLAIVRSGIVELDEVMLPYMIGDGGQTMYQAYRKQLPPSEGKR